MRHVLAHQLAQMRLTERDQAVQAFKHSRRRIDPTNLSAKAFGFGLFDGGRTGVTWALVSRLDTAHGPGHARARQAGAAALGEAQVSITNLLTKDAIFLTQVRNHQHVVLT